MKHANTTSKLEDNSLWKETGEIVEYMYAKLHELPAEEKWDTESKLRTSANNLLFTVSQAIGDASPGGSEYEWGSARKYASGLKAMYRFAYRQNFIELEPSMMVRLNKLIEAIDDEVAQAYKQTEAHNKKEIELWHKKYRLWKETNKDTI